MKFLIIGLGSMGKRRIRNLVHIGFSEIIGFDPRSDRRDEAASLYDIETVGDWDVAQSLDVDAWVISTPPDTHLDYGFQAVEKGIHFFTEANVDDARTPQMIAALDQSGTVGAPSCTMLYNPGPRKIKELVAANAIGKPLMLTYHTGQYLPDWHPWERYQDFYVSKRETGACREIVPYELLWMIDVFGQISSITGMKSKVTDLDYDIDDVYQMLFSFESGLSGHLAVDVVSRPAVRVFRLCGSEGSLDWDHANNAIRLWSPSDSPNDYVCETIPLAETTVADGYINPEEPYIAEMTDFVAACKGEQAWPYTFIDDEAILNLLLMAEKSSDIGEHQS
jgi:predicted dehydrogenase